MYITIIYMNFKGRQKRKKPAVAFLLRRVLCLNIVDEVVLVDALVQKVLQLFGGISLSFAGLAATYSSAS